MLILIRDEATNFSKWLKNMEKTKEQLISSLTPRPKQEVRVVKNSYHAGKPRSVRRLKTLAFDPIGELVTNYRRIEAEIAYQEKIRSGEVVELLPSGKPRSYRPEVHQGLYDKLIAIGKELLRYGYGRVPETTIVEEKKPMPLIVNLSKDGETYTVNDAEDIEDSYDENDED